MDQFTHFSLIKTPGLVLVPRRRNVFQTTIKWMFRAFGKFVIRTADAILPAQLPALSPFPKCGGAVSFSGNCCLVQKERYSFSFSNNYLDNYLSHHYWRMRSERVVVRVVVLEGKASAVQMKQFTHLTAIKTPILVRVPRQRGVLQTTIKLMF